MRADFTANGVLQLTPENGAEEWALKEWKDRNHIAVDDPNRMETSWLRGSAVLIQTKSKAPLRPRMDDVWLHRLDCTHAQIEKAIDQDGPRYLLRWSMLDEDQKTDYLNGGKQ